MNIYWRRFGVEMETSTVFPEMLDIVKPIIKTVYGRRKLFASNTRYKSASEYQWHLKKDISTQSELVTPISTYKNLVHMHKVIDHINKKGVKITRNDGMHIHMQAQKNKLDNIIIAWLQIETVIRRCFPRHRRCNFQCEPLNRSFTRDYDRKAMRHRFYKFNKIFDKVKENSDEHQNDISFSYYHERSTVEFRLSEGTFNPTIIKNWIKFYMLFLNYAETTDFNRILSLGKTWDIKNIDDLKYLLNIKDKKLIQFLTDRYRCNFKKGT